MQMRNRILLKILPSDDGFIYISIVREDYNRKQPRERLDKNNARSAQTIKAERGQIYEVYE